MMADQFEQILKEALQPVHDRIVSLSANFKELLDAKDARIALGDELARAVAVFNSVYEDLGCIPGHREMIAALTTYQDKGTSECQNQQQQ